MTPALPTPRLERAPRPEADTDSGPLADPAPAAPPSRASKPALLYRLCKDAVMAWIDDFAPSMRDSSPGGVCSGVSKGGRGAAWIGSFICFSLNGRMRGRIGERPDARVRGGDAESLGASLAHHRVAP